MKGTTVINLVSSLLPNTKNREELLPELSLAAHTPEPIPLETRICQAGLLGGARGDRAFLPFF